MRWRLNELSGWSIFSFRRNWHTKPHIWNCIEQIQYLLEIDGWDIRNNYLTTVALLIYCILYCCCHLYGHLILLVMIHSQKHTQTSSFFFFRIYLRIKCRITKKPIATNESKGSDDNSLGAKSTTHRMGKWKKERGRENEPKKKWLNEPENGKKWMEILYENGYHFDCHLFHCHI